SLTFTDMTKETVDAAYIIVTGLNIEYARNKQHLQYLYLLDDVQSTPYLIAKIRESLKTVEATLVHSTAAVADPFLTKVLEAIVMPIISKIMRPTIKFCATEVEAFTWL